MKNLIRLSILVSCFVLTYQLNAQSGAERTPKSFQNDICIPSKLYMLEGVQNNLFVEPLIRRWRPYNDVVRFSGSAAYQRRLQRVASITEPRDGASVILNLINTDELDTVKTVSSILVVGKPGKGDNTVAVSVLGDSFTNGAFFKYALLEKGFIPNIRMIGLRDVVGYEGQYDEGRGGWTLNHYFSVTKGRTDAYNGLFQPRGEFRYWGSTHFWKLANEIRLQPKANWSFGESYNAGRFQTLSLNFDGKTGYLLNPVKNDLMYDNTMDCFVCFNGHKWISANYEDFTWDLDYGKYLKMWNLEAPVILAEFLGLNDFRGANSPKDIDFSKWNSQMERLITSYLKAVPKGRFVLMIPCSTCGILDNVAGDFTIRQNACMWEHRRNIIEKFDKREEEHVYVLDAAISIDSEAGYNYKTDSLSTLPYETYPGNKQMEIQTGNPHPYPNYPTMGYSLAAFIQKYR